MCQMHECNLTPLASVYENKYSSSIIRALGKITKQKKCICIWDKYNLFSTSFFNKYYKNVRNGQNIIVEKK